MKIYDRDLRKVKVDILLNNEIRFRGMKKPPAKIKVKAVKYDNDIVKVELAEIPQVLKYKIEREKKQKEKVEKKKEEKKPEEKKEELEKKLEEEKKEEEKEEKPEEKKEKEEKREAGREAGLKIAKEEHRKMKHEVTGKKQPKIHRMALQK